MDFLCLDFINSQWYRTHERHAEPLRDPAWLRQLCAAWELPDLTTDGKEDREHVTERLLTLRDELFGAALELCAAHAVSPARRDALNARLRGMTFHYALRGGDDASRLEAVPCAEAAGDIATQAIVLSFARLAADYPLDRLKCCDNPDCDWLFYDDSRNRTKKWCENRCASLVKVRRHRARKAGKV